MNLAFLKLYSFEENAKTYLAAYSQPYQSKTRKISTAINNFGNTKFLSALIIPLYLAVVLAYFLLGL
jgi:hypothetical protein